ncbi:putative ATP-dependent RNA helicase RhlE [Monocercomonoides exilis]|uniref:putative ATP-dependent RNA helicase RhlE n=1 Tax=Monocercomonoides exilis TaxID=2049356 RepID=UPI00355A673C|nr:putative ATP-dependent RNA helicase RhlE [Monocercomonoides exilis]|eukprot:MONOS_1119.1-p1 / transcript=MONOS_1119.1 / gene=MONOS_1119 / organism=Monocercomonoides_exilis_PA203 / gene_product=ATP-dependent RNA helicase RhlE / transcript_product=ATP-dependent RNA helicase RhlE / location=Mono_scaffold00019:25799-33796(-) / protein_length=2665 / sequence_SO=supercontig / SO=protein_coding / is_pseudo=false
MEESVSVSFLEKFVFAKDEKERDVALEVLPANSSEHLYYAILREQLKSPEHSTAEEEKLLEKLANKLGKNSSLVSQLKLRRNLISFGKMNKASQKELLQYLRDDILHKDFTSVQRRVGARDEPRDETALPTVLNEGEVNFGNVLKEVEKRPHMLNNLTSEGMLKVDAKKLETYDLQKFINNLPSGSYPGLLDLIKLYLSKPNTHLSDLSVGLTFDQLQKLGDEKPELRNNQHWVEMMLVRMVPEVDVVWETDKIAQDKYFERIWNMACQLNDTALWMGASLMEVCVVHDWLSGQPNLGRFLNLLMCPRRDVSFCKLWRNMSNSYRNECRVDTYWLEKIGAPRAELQWMGQNGSTELIRKEVIYFIAQGVNEQKFQTYIEETELRRLVTEAKLTNGKMDVSKVGAKDADEYFVRRLTEKTELTFADNNQTYFGFGSEAEEIPSLNVVVKNVKEVRLQVFEVNTQAFYSLMHREVDAGMELDGLVANYERLLDFSAYAPVIRHTERIDLPSLVLDRKGEKGEEEDEDEDEVERGEGERVQKRGVFVVVLSGGGLTSRALIRKGGLRMMWRCIADGQAVTVLDELNMPLPRSRVAVWVDGKKHSASTTPKKHPALEPCEILVPYATGSGAGIKQVIVEDLADEFCMLVNGFEHKSEEYEFGCGIYIDREELIRHADAHILLRPQLLCCGVPASVGMVRGVSVKVTSTTVEGIDVTRQYAGLQFVDGELACVEYTVPEMLSKVQVQVNGVVAVHSDLGRTVPVSSEKTFTVNTIDNTREIIAAALVRTTKDQKGKNEQPGYVLRVFGKSGERMKHHPVSFKFFWRYMFSGSNCYTAGMRLMTDKNGEIMLGSLKDVSAFEITMGSGDGTNETSQLFGLEGHGIVPMPMHLQARSHRVVSYAGQELEVPLEMGCAEGTEESFGIKIKENARKGNRMAENGLVSLTQMGGPNASVPLQDVSDQMVFREGKAVLSANLSSGEYEMFEWQTGLTTIISLIEPRKTCANNEIKEKHEKSGSKISDAEIKGKEENNSEMKQDTTSLLCGARRIGQRGADAAVAIVGVRQIREGAEAGNVEVILNNCTEMTRVHAFGTRFVGSFDPEMQLTAVRHVRQAEVTTAMAASSFYTSDNRLGTEQEYIQRRQSSAARLGNTLDAPSVLMHPVVTQETSRKEATSYSSDAIYGGATNGALMAKMKSKEFKRLSSQDSRTDNWRECKVDRKNIDFLTDTTTVILNQPVGVGQTQRVVIPSQVIGQKGQSTLTVVATDDEHVVARVLAVDLSLCSGRKKVEGEEEEGQLREMRLMNAFDPKKHVLQKMHSALILPKKVLNDSCCEACNEKEKEEKAATSSSSASSECACASRNSNGSVSLKKAYLSKCVASRTIDDLSTSTYETYSCFGGILHLLKCLMKADLKNEAPVGTFDAWCDAFEELYKLVDEGKDEGEKERKKKYRELCERYSEFACHETNLLLYKKAPKFFEQAIRPALASKKEKTVIDHYLLATEDVELFEEYAEPALFAQLNAVEQVFVLARLVALGQAEKKAGRGDELLKRSVARCVALVEKVEGKLKAEQRGKEAEERLFKMALKSGLDVGELIEAENEEGKNDASRKSGVKEASARAFNEGEDLGQMLIFAKTITGKCLPFFVKRNTTVEELKDMICRKEGIPPDQQRIISEGKQLEDRYTMGYYNIKNKTTLHLVLRLRGGGTGPELMLDTSLTRESAPMAAGFGFAPQMLMRSVQSRSMNFAAPVCCSAAPPPMPMPMKMKMAVQNVHYDYDAEEEEIAPVAKFQQVENTKEYRENQYHRVANGDGCLLGWNEFFLDYAKYLFGCMADGIGADASDCANCVPFVSANVLDCADSFSSAAFAAALTDVSLCPISVEKAIQMSGGRASASISSENTAALLYVKEMEAVEEGKEDSAQERKSMRTEKQEEKASGKIVQMKQVLVQEFVCDMAEEWEVNEEGRRTRKYVDWEKMYVGRVYMCDVVLTNTTATQRSVEVLMQVPAGSIPLLKGSMTKTQSIVLGAYGTKTLSYVFYFPRGGAFVHYPAQVAMRGHYMCCSREGGHKVLVAEHATAQPERRDWAYVSQEAEKEVLLEFLEKENLHRADVDLSMIAWRLRDKDVFDAVIAILMRRGVYNEKVYSYSLKHFGPAAAVQRYLCDLFVSKEIVTRLSNFATVLSPLCVKNPVTNGALRVLEYRPLINPRTFLFGEEKEHIPNANLAQQYRKYLVFLAHGAAAAYASSSLLESDTDIERDEEYYGYSQWMPEMSGSSLLGDGEKLVLTYYLLLQDRLDEARALFDTIGMESTSASGSTKQKRENENEMEMKLQYDYMSAYLDMTNPESALPVKKSGECGEETMEAPRLTVARQVAEKHRNCSIPRWKLMFDHLNEQIKEVDKTFAAERREKEKEKEKREEEEKEVKGGRKKNILVENEAERESKRQKQLEESMTVEATVEMVIDAKANTITIQQQNGKEKTGKIKFYRVDIESLFSAKPFMKGKDSAKAFSIVKPTKQIEFSFEESNSASSSSSSSSSSAQLARSVVVHVPDELQRQNVFVEVEYEGKSRSDALFNCGMDVELFEDTGRLEVKEESSHRPVPGVYVKVYGKQGGESGAFVKDGFTDLRGCFDYASVNKSTNSSSYGSGRANYETSRRFSILIMSDSLGSVVKEVDAPAEN